MLPAHALGKGEVAGLKKRLHKTPVRWVSNHIGKETRVFKAKINSLPDIGGLETIWGHLGGVFSFREYGHSRFQVSEVLATLRNPQCRDSSLLHRIENFIRLIAKGYKNFNVILGKIGNNYIILDGNKRTVAYYEYAREKGITDLNLPVYIVSFPRMPFRLQWSMRTPRKLMWSLYTINPKVFLISLVFFISHSLRSACAISPPASSCARRPINN